MWRELVKIYAIRAREFSDAVARLGRHAEMGPESLSLLQEIRRRRELCCSAGDEIERHIQKIAVREA